MNADETVIGCSHPIRLTGCESCHRKTCAELGHPKAELCRCAPVAEPADVEAAWVAVSCEIADIIRHSEHVKPTASKTDLDGNYGTPEVYTEWSVTFPSGNEVAVLREHRWPGLIHENPNAPDAKPCEHYALGATR